MQHSARAGADRACSQRLGLGDRAHAPSRPHWASFAAAGERCRRQFLRYRQSAAIAAAENPRALSCVADLTDRRQFSFGFHDLFTHSQRKGFPLAGGFPMSVFGKLGAVLTLVGASALGFHSVDATQGGTCCRGANCACETCDCDGNSCTNCHCPDCGCAHCGCGDSCPAEK